MLKNVAIGVIVELIPLGLTFDPYFINATATILKVDPVFYIFYVNDKPEIAFGLFEVDKKIIVNHIFPYYSGIWIREDLNSLKTRDNLCEAIKSINQIYKSIKIVLPIVFKDVRCFIWNNYDVRTKYTYIKNVAEFDFKTNVKRHYQSALKHLNLILIESAFDEGEWENHLNFLKNLGLAKTHLNNVKDWILALMNIDIVKFLCVRNENDEILGSIILLLNKKCQEASLLYSHVKKDKDQSKVNAFLYIESQKWLKDNGFLRFDYLGANIKSISDYKSNFNPDLVSYYMVHYSKWNNYTNLLDRLIWKL